MAFRARRPRPAAAQGVRGKLIDFEDPGRDDVFARGKIEDFPSAPVKDLSIAVSAKRPGAKKNAASPAPATAAAVELASPAKEFDTAPGARTPRRRSRGGHHPDARPPGKR